MSERLRLEWVGMWRLIGCAMMWAVLLVPHVGAAGTHDMMVQIRWIWICSLESQRSLCRGHLQVGCEAMTIQLCEPYCDTILCKTFFNLFAGALSSTEDARQCWNSQEQNELRKNRLEAELRSLESQQRQHQTRTSMGQQWSMARIMIHSPQCGNPPLEYYQKFM